jgi:hypothetical protein
VEIGPPVFRRALFPWGLLGMLALVGLVEGLMSRNEIDLKTDWHWEWRVNGRVAMRQAARFDVLCFGDSLINHGLVPPILETRLGKPVYNLSLSGGQSSTSYIQLRRALDAGARPSAVIVDFFPLLLNHGYEENEPRWPDLLTPRECLDLAWMVRDASFFARMMLARHLPSLRERTSLRAHLLAALGGKGGSERLGALAYQRNWRLNHGTSVFAKAENIKLGDMDAWYRAAFRNPEWCAPYHAAYLVRFLELAAARDIPVFWLVPPIHPEAQRRFDKGGTEARYDQLLRSALRRFPNVVVIDGRRARYDASVFVDQAHLDRQGASVLSADVADIVSRALAGPAPKDHWVDLPRYRPQSLDSSIEDIHQSRTIVQRQAELLRR